MKERRIKDIKLPAFINREGTTATHPSIAYDPVTKKEILYFVSDQVGGEGGLDIWYSEITEKGKFNKPKNLGKPINTIGNEITPFLSDGILYFSSDHHLGLGGYDIFKVKKEGNDWAAPKNMGVPLNSSYNDTYFVLNDSETMGYLSSNRWGAFTLTKNACCNDIYKVNFVKEKTNEPEQPIEPLPKDSMLLADKPNITTPKIAVISKSKSIFSTYQSNKAKDVVRIS